MTRRDPQHWGQFSRFPAEQGTVICSPPAAGSGYWVGAPGAMYDATDGSFYLIYRVRRPRGVQPDRGAEIHLLRGSDGVQFEEIWSGTKDQLSTTSIERCGLRRLGPDRWALYVSYVDPADGRWRIDVCEAASPEKFDLRNCRPILTAADIDADGVKDPFLFQVAGQYHMIVSFATAVAADAEANALHGTHDAYNTGLIRSRTGLATSEDGLNWRWQGAVMEPSREGWDRYCARIGCVFRADGLWLALYDGSADVSENYEERVGLAYSSDLRTFHRVTEAGPLMQPAHGPSALRYFDVLDFGDSRFIYYELARPDGSHDLRVWRT
ncbi:MAG: hypothetical protein KDA59_01050 [Planctomycetales bacterium]|nr:hypothetical protein [Planctomycetales bacterium]